MYSEHDLVKIAKRENNTKRNYLVVNRFQGKHVPVEPSKAFFLFDELAEKVKIAYADEKLLLIGFAETATAIGAHLAINLGSYYIQTTRELIPEVEYLFFSEEHSHATEQKLVKNDISKIAPQIDRIVFVEDEVTTGNTILNIIRILREQFPAVKKYSVASLLNGMSKDSLERYKEENIKLHYLIKTDHSKYSIIADKFKGNGTYINDLCENINYGTKIEKINVGSYLNSRRLVNGIEYSHAVKQLWYKINESIKFSEYESILVIGTEEFMYPALYVSKQLEDFGKQVKTHSTTRSPIEVSLEDEYPLHTRYELRSFYDDERITYIYDLDTYDCVIILTDSVKIDGYGMNTLLHELSKKNKKIYVVRWC